ncbi:MAG: hypothetical protein LKE46_00035 [Clostridium sp.]|jgi:hypothetical protein|uniref:DUF7446 family protein n=1 Tax=Clostridium sp. TaxID=1506 RepID=UPI0025C124F7|nr:hypothetical protein [Clostridium sp.]MCH3962655.1 hypothetical protein [Clostridium sp.]MCI2201041.1 hypothetical protein [Clostridium sp.]
MEFGTSYLSDKIYMGTSKKLKDGTAIWTKQTDVTDAVVKAVFEHMYLEAEKTGAYEISIPGFGKMVFTREGKTGDTK